MRIPLARTALTAALLSSATLFTPAASADELVDAADPARMVSILRGLGHPAQLDTDEVGDPLIRSEVSGTRFAILFWGLFASLVAIWAAELGSLIEVVNRFGSLFYGSILGVFILAVGFPSANSTGALTGMAAGMTVIVSLATFTRLAFLWHNPIGALVVVSVGLLVSALTGNRKLATGNS